MSEVSKAYDQWAASYDEVDNRTRDMDKLATRTVLGRFSFDSVLEPGCGTGKNTEWLKERSKQIIAADFSDEMLGEAAKKIKDQHVSFQKLDITNEWPFEKDQFDLVTLNLVLEHIKDLPPVFEKAAGVLKPGGHLFISELHPAKQYLGTKARFEKEGKLIVIECHTHHVSEFLQPSYKHFELRDFREWFDEDNPNVPRLLSMLFRRR